MKNYRLFGWLAMVLLGQNLAAQSTQAQQDYWHPGFSMGIISVGYGAFTRPDVPVPQIITPANGVVGDILDLNYVFRNRWGMRLTINLMRTDSAENFRLLQTKLPGYFLQDVSQDLPTFVGSRVLLGATYSQPKGRFFFQPALLFGFTGFDYKRLQVNAKEQGTNQLYTLKFRSADESVSVLSPTLLIGSKIGYFITKRTSLHILVDFAAMRHTFKYVYLQTDEIDHTVSMEPLSYKTWQYSASVQLGVTAFFGKSRPQ